VCSSVSAITEGIILTIVAIIGLSATLVWLFLDATNDIIDTEQHAS